MLLPGVLADVSLDFLEGGDNEEILVDVNSVFTYSDTNNPINSCSFHQANDCDGLPFTSTDDLTLISTLPPTVSVSISNIDGFSNSLCLRCSNGVYTEDLDNWTITQLQKPCTPGITASQFDKVQTMAAFTIEIGSFSFPAFTEGCENDITYEIGTQKNPGIIPQGLFEEIEQVDGDVFISTKPFLS